MYFNIKALEKIHEKHFNGEVLTQEETKILAKPLKLISILFYLLETTYLEMYDANSPYLNQGLKKKTRMALEKWDGISNIFNDALKNAGEKQPEMLRLLDEIREDIMRKFSFDE